MLTVRNALPEPQAMPWLQENLALAQGHALFAVALLCVAVLGQSVASDAFSIAQISAGLL